MNISFEVDEKYFKNLMNKMHTDDPLLVISHALASLQWIISEKEQNKEIFSSLEDGTEIVMLALPEPKEKNN